ncbi:MAG: hypothetical protein AB3N24_24715 [Leisingera sp.]
MGLKFAAQYLANEANEKCSGDPREPFIALMTAAAMAGHIIERTPEEMHSVLDQVLDIAQAALLEATQTKQ